MEGLIFIGLLVLNTAISVWNAYASGAYLTESKIIGGWTRFIVWCGLIMAGCGFTWVILTILTMVAIAMQWLTPEWGTVAMKLGYFIIILPVIGSGFGIWAHSLVNAYRRRSFGNIAVASWNTYAQVKNVWDAASHAPGFFDEVLDAFTKNRRRSSKDEAMAVIVIVIVVVAILGGALITGAIAKWADRRVAIDVTGSNG